jgi:hypothetical protein
VAAKHRRTARERRIENLIKNLALVTMGLFEEGLSDIADMLTQSAVEDGIGGEGAGVQLSPRVRLEIHGIFEDMREEIESQWPKNPAVFRRYVAQPALDEGIKIVERYDFNRPKLTQALDDEILASYVFLLMSGDKPLIGMFKELEEWQKRLSPPPWAT